MARISIPIDDQLKDELDKIFPWGTLAPTVRKVLESLVKEVKTNGVSVIEELLNDKFNPLERQRGKLQ